MRFLLEPDGVGDPAALVHETEAARAAGLDGIMLRQGPGLPAPLITAAALAARVPDLLLAVELDLGDRHPFEVAEEAAVVDLASGGRLLLVVRPAAGAEADFGEAVDLIRTALTPRPFRFEGHRWRVPANLPENEHGLESHVRLTPAPAQVQLPIWGAGAGRDAALERGLGYLADREADGVALGVAHARAAETLGPVAIGAPRGRRERLVDANELVDRLREGRTTFGQDWAVVTGDAETAASLGTRVRPRVQLHRLDPALEALWETVEA
jgi:alkanesulfonate monooxygenase SsuD/methylene tetrahydromethanopterin reductase-like flavin-dependent oxidoreductase (luciferase family)